MPSGTNVLTFRRKRLSSSSEYSTMRSFPGVKCGRGVLLTTHPLLVPRSWKIRAIPLPHPLGHTGRVTGSLYLLVFYLGDEDSRLLPTVGNFLADYTKPCQLAVTDVPEEHMAFIFRVKQAKHSGRAEMYQLRKQKTYKKTRHN